LVESMTSSKRFSTWVQAVFNGYAGHGIPRSECNMRAARLGERTKQFKKSPAIREALIF
jgi:hypothetical protein